MSDDIVERLRNTRPWFGKIVMDAAEEIERLRKALEIFIPPQQSAIEQIIWKDEPDDALMTISISFGKYREARDAFAPVGGSGT